MKKITLVLIFLIQSLLINAQYTISQKQYDSLTLLLAKAVADTVKIDLLFQLAVANQFANPNKTVEYFNQALPLARKINDKYRTMGCLITLGFTYTHIGEPVKAIEMFQEVLRYAEETKSDPTMALAFIGINYEAQGDLANGLEYARRAFLMYEESIKNKSSPIIDERGYVAGPLQLGIIFEKMGQLDSAMHYAKMSYDRISERGKDDGMSYFYCQICNLFGSIYIRLNQSEDALRFYNLALNKAVEVNFQPSLQESQIGLANFYFTKNQLDSVIHYATQAYEGATKIKGFEVMKTSTRLLRMAYEKKGLYSKALYYSDLSIAARDSVSGAEKVRDVLNIAHKEERRQQIMQQKIEAENAAFQSKIKIYSLLAILVGAFLLATFLYRNNRQKQIANALLHNQKEEIQSTLSQLKATQAQLIQSEKLASLGELTAGIAHEIQNPLNFVNNFSELSVDLVKDLKEELKRPDKDETYIDELFDDLSQNQEKINHHGKRASSIVKGMLEHSRASTGIRELTDINKLADEYLRLAYHGLRAKDNSFNADFELIIDENLPKIEVIPQDMGRVLLNLINNAFYAVSQRRAAMLTAQTEYDPSVLVTTQHIDNQIIIKVKDNGIGMSEAVKAKVFQPFFTTKPTGQGTGLGLSLAYDIVTKGHGGTLEVESTEGVGSEFIIKI